MLDQTVSYSEFKAYTECPLRWKLMYVDGLKDERDSIDTIFGTSVHETIQQWLPLHFANPTKAKKLDLNIPLKERLIENFKMSITENVDGTKNFICPKEVLQEYYEDGCEILTHLQKYANEFFPTKGYELVGCEVPLMTPITGKSLLFKGFLDIVIHETIANFYHIIDLKTSRAGWYSAQRRDSKKINQLLLYKKYYAEQFSVDPANIFPKFIILKRKIQGHTDFPIKRLSNFEPSHGTISMKKVSVEFEHFLDECYDNGQRRTDNIKATPSESSCRFCIFRNNETLCKHSWYHRSKK